VYRGGALSLGPVTVPYTWLFLALSLAAGYAVFSYLMKKNRETGKLVGSLLVNSLLLWVGIWKAAPLIFQWKAVTSHPMLLLYLPGGLPGTLIGFAGAGAYLFFAVRKRKIPWKQFSLPLAIGLGTALSFALVLNFLVLRPFPAAAGASTAEAEIGTSPGDRAPGFTLPDLTGSPKSLSDYHGKLLFLNFWATWCPPCKAEIPEMARFYREHADNPVEIAAVNLTASESGIEAVKTFVRERNIPFPVLIDDQNIAEFLFQVTAVPTTFVISPEGIILGKKTGSVNAAWMKRQLSYAESTVR
jgi:thiol-disulfide isomerase/thioredoxin